MHHIVVPSRRLTARPARGRAIYFEKAPSIAALTPTSASGVSTSTSAALPSSGTSAPRANIGYDRPAADRLGFAAPGFAVVNGALAQAEEQLLQSNGPPADRSSSGEEMPLFTTDLRTRSAAAC